MEIFLSDGVRFEGIHDDFPIISDEVKKSAPAENYHEKA